jgi:AAA15 family ATPase/GTPase
MLHSINIKKFKAIQTQNGLTLNNLAPINYLIGKNGSGKSSILEWINKNKSHIFGSSEIINLIKQIHYNDDNNLRLPQKTQK